MERVRKGPTGRKFSDPARNAEIIRLFRSGLTTTEIAPLFGIGPRAVVGMLQAHGVDRNEGGKAELARQRHAALLKAKEHVFPRRHGVRLEDFASLDQCKDAYKKFSDQRQRAAQRGIGWEMTFAQWWSIWSESGAWNQRGRSAAESAVMSRYGDEGPYAVGNVRILTLAGNFAESHLVRGHRVREELLTAPVCFRTPASEMATDGNGRCHLLAER